MTEKTTKKNTVRFTRTGDAPVIDVRGVTKSIAFLREKYRSPISFRKGNSIAPKS